MKAEAALACGFVTALGGEDLLAALPAPVADRETVGRDGREGGASRQAARACSEGTVAAHPLK